METGPKNLLEELNKRRQIVHVALKNRTLWYIRLRWFVPPAIVAGTLIAQSLGFQIEIYPLIYTAVVILFYNLLFYLWNKGVVRYGGWQTDDIKLFSYLQVVFDYAATFYLIHETGGAASPLIFFMLIHIIFASMLLPPITAYMFGFIVIVGLALLFSAEYLNWIDYNPIIFQGRAVDLAKHPFAFIVEIGFFAIAVFMLTYTTTSIMPVFRKRIQNLAELSETIITLSNKLNALYLLTQSITTTNRFQEVLDTVTSELTHLMKIQAVSIKLLSEDGKTLRYTSAYGLPEKFIKEHIVELDKSPLNRQIIDGKPYVVGKITQHEIFQFGQYLEEAHIESVLFVPISIENKVLGILGAYCSEVEKFGVDELDFFRLSAGIVAVALENAKAFETIEKLNSEKLWFMMQVAHNLRAPVNANLSTIDLILNGHFGEPTEDAKKYLLRIVEKSRAMLQMLNELMTLAETRSRQKEMEFVNVDLRKIAEKTKNIFSVNAANKGLSLGVHIEENVQPVLGDPELIEQLFENLVSNGIKYTLKGKVEIGISQVDGNVRIIFKDTGIGIPEDAIHRIFSEFFRADNAKQIDETGTGLGLAIVKNIVLKHNGKISVKSSVYDGTAFTILLPASPHAGLGAERQ